MVGVDGVEAVEAVEAVEGTMGTAEGSAVVTASPALRPTSPLLHAEPEGSLQLVMRREIGDFGGGSLEQLRPWRGSQWPRPASGVPSCTKPPGAT